MQMIVKGVLAGFWLIFVPVAAGIPFVKKKKDYTLGESFLAGLLLMLAVAQLLILPGIFRKLSLHLVTLLFAIVMGLCAVYGLYGFAGSAGSYGKRLRKSIPEISPWMWIAAGMILVQIGVCVYYAHMDADDAFYVATATTSVHTDSIFAYNPYSGAEYAVFPRRYVLSPFPVLLAVISQLSGGLHPAVTAHTIYPVVFLLAAYLVYHQFGRLWFAEKRREQGVFLLFCAVIIWFSGFSVYTGGNFMLVRIWQGKAVLAAVILPFLIYLGLVLMLEDQLEYPWLLLAMANLAACHVSSMGIMLAPVVTGLFVLLALVKNRSPRRFLYGILCCMPSLLLGGVYLCL